MDLVYNSIHNFITIGCHLLLNVWDIYLVYLIIRKNYKSYSKINEFLMPNITLIFGKNDNSH